MNASTASLSEEHHPRVFRQNTYVYPVLSRRAGGVSIGINLNPDKACNFDCVYCQVDRTVAQSEQFVGTPKLLAELADVLRGLGPGGPYWNEPEFSGIAPQKRHVTDIAFSGDGEPTTFRNFSDVVTRCVQVKEQLGFTDAKVVLITNATGLDRPDVRQALEFMDAHRGEVWAKLDAGTPEYFAMIDRTAFPFPKLLATLTECARQRPIVIQSCFINFEGAAPAASEINAYAARLKNILAEGGRILRVQVYTIARAPAVAAAQSLADAEVDAIAQRVRDETGLVAEAFHGHATPRPD